VTKGAQSIGMSTGIARARLVCDKQHFPTNVDKLSCLLGLTFIHMQGEERKQWRKDHPHVSVSLAVCHVSYMRYLFLYAGILGKTRKE
jgi:hypothetical protein